MSIASEITRIQGAKADLKTAIEGKGVTVPPSTKLDGYADLVDDIQTGGEPILQDKTVSYTPTESTQTATVTADSGYDGLEEVSITVGAIDSEYVGSDIPRKSSADLTVSGATVNVPSGYYSALASKSVKNGTEGTPTATKGTVANHSVDITPSVTNVEGYIQGGTKNGSSVKVSASELVSGTLEIDSSGTKDVTNYKNVSVPSGTEGTPTASKGAVSNHSVSVTPSVINTEGYIDGGTKTGTAVTVSASELVSGTKQITANGTEDVTNYASVSVAVPNSYSASDEGKVVDNGALVAQTSATYTENDTYDTTKINSVTVNVSDGGDGMSWSDFVSRTLKESDRAVDFGTQTPNQVLINKQYFYSKLNITSVKWLASSNTTITSADRAFYQCTSLKTFIAPKIAGSLAATSQYLFGGCTALEKGEFNFQQIYNTTFNGCSRLAIVVMRATSVRTLQNIGAFTGTPFASGGSGGTLYVPNSILSNYQSASNWSTILGYANNSIKSIESTETDPNAPIDLTRYYVDGTPIS